MLKNFVVIVLLMSSLFSTNSFAIIAVNQRNALHDKLKEISALRDLSGRHVFPVYQSSDKQFFVAIRAISSGIKPYIIDNPNESKSTEQVWQAYLTARAQASKPQSAEEFKRLDESTLVGFLVYRSGDWQDLVEKDSSLAPYLLSDKELLAVVGDTVPYFDSSEEKSASDVESSGVVFHASPRRAHEFRKLLNERVLKDEASRLAAKEIKSNHADL